MTGSGWHWSSGVSKACFGVWAIRASFGRGISPQWRNTREISPSCVSLGWPWTRCQNLAQFLSDTEEILRKFEEDAGPLPEIPERLLMDARALGRDV
jgi:hypothetical protein